MRRASGEEMMRKCHPLAIWAAAAVLVVAVPAASSLKKARSLPFAAGETLTYNVTWSIFPAGQVVAKIESGGGPGSQDFVVKTSALSTGFVSLLYKVQDVYHSVFDPQTLCSQRISKTINEGRRHKVTNIVFDASRRLALLDERNEDNPHDPVSHKTHAIPACVEDVVSAFYYLRAQPMRIGEKIQLAVNDGSKTKQVTATVEGREPVQTPLGTFQAFRVEPTVFGDLYKRKGRMVIWFSDDKRHLPLRIKAMLSVGAITGTLSSYTPGEAIAPHTR
jgi:hypothetical protein